MAAYRLTSEASADLDGIYEYTILTFGLDQAQDYLHGLHERFGTLAGNPGLGRPASDLAPELRRFRYQSHVVFYLPEEHGVLIVRVLHQNMDFPRHFKEGENASN